MYVRVVQQGLTLLASAPSGVTRARASWSTSSQLRQMSALAVRVETTPATPLSSRMTRARRLPMPSTSCLLVSHFAAVTMCCRRDGRVPQMRESTSLLAHGSHVTWMLRTVSHSPTFVS